MCQRRLLDTTCKEDCGSRCFPSFAYRRWHSRGVIFRVSSPVPHLKLLDLSSFFLLLLILSSRWEHRMGGVSGIWFRSFPSSFDLHSVMASACTTSRYSNSKYESVTLFVDCIRGERQWCPRVHLLHPGGQSELRITALSVWIRQRFFSVAQDHPLLDSWSQ